MYRRYSIVDAARMREEAEKLQAWLFALRPLAVSDLLDFARTSIERGLFIPAKSDMVVQLEDESRVLKFCDESDIHLDSDNRKLIDEMIARWKGQGFAGYEKVGNEWVRFADAK